ncbi:hypothetical protein [Thermococcus sp. 2319x1]|uniref:hypothetical protein n=1 Tax=Thermococcus sp. 2319x1 TaxID=1674923 RepID=UPI0015823754|nr:hypothetical protein [Thermococcus sp. 2319x1]
MSKLKDGLAYPPIKAGFILLFIAFIMSLGASYNVLREKTWMGNWKPGNYTLGEEIEDSVNIISRTLKISSDNASVKIVTEGSEDSYILSGDTKILHLTSRVSILVEMGEVTYSYTVKWIDYPYDYLSFPAFFMMIVGSVLAIRGYFSFLESLKEDKLQQKRRIVK